MSFEKLLLAKVELSSTAKARAVALLWSSGDREVDRANLRLELPPPGAEARAPAARPGTPVTPVPESHVPDPNFARTAGLKVAC